MALVRCLGCGQAFEAMGHTVACPMCGVVMKISAPPPGTVVPMEARPESVVMPVTAPPPMPSTRRATSSSDEPWLSDTAKMWIGIVVGVLLFALFIDWFRMKITPAKKVVDQVAVEKLAQDLAQEQVDQLKARVAKLEAATRQSQPPTAVAGTGDTGTTGTTTTAAPSTNPPAQNQVVASAAPAGPKGENWSAALNRMAKEQGVPTAAPTSRPVRDAEFASLVGLTPVRPKDRPDASVTDIQIDRALRRGVDYFVNEFGPRQLKGADQYGDQYPGVDAISLYALLMAGQSVHDERVRSVTPAVKNWLEGLKDLPMDNGKATYSRSLRISALGVFNRKEDRLTLNNDAKWLQESAVQGAFTYTKPPPGTQVLGGDNSNSQYGGLGLWAAADAGAPVAGGFWRDCEQHWTESQIQTSGGWAYTGNTGSATLSMTAAGVTMLMVARDQMAAEGSAFAGGPLTTSKALERGLEWLDEGDHAVDINGSWYGYTLYGLERAGLASGYKYFGRHDWYRELAKRAVESQREDGGWETGGLKPVETAFHLLFLARGREPIFMGKLRFDGNWSNRPRDVAMLTRVAGKTLERSLNWQVLGTQRDWTDWTDAPVLLITSDDAPSLSDGDVAKLRSYALAGGLIFTHAENGSGKFNAFAADLAKRMFPEYPLTPLPPTHGVYSAVYPMTARPALSAVGNGSRLLMVHCPTDLTKQWGVRFDPAREKAPQPGTQLAINLVTYATGKRDLRRRTESLYVAERTGQPIATIPVARLKYNGNWDPEPWGWTRASRKFDYATSIGLEVKPTDIVALEPKTAPIAHLTGTAAYSFTDAEVKVLREYVQAGGVLLVDACGGSQGFADSVRTSLIARAFPSATPAMVTSDHSLMGHGRSWMSEITKLLTRGDTSSAQGLITIGAGKGAVVFSDLDISTGLLGTTVSGVRGYEPTVAEKLVQNLVVWAIWPDGAPPEPKEDATQPVKK